MTQENQPEKKKKRRISDELVKETMFEMCQAAGVDGAVRPEDIARAIYPEQWQTLLKRIRLMAKQQARAGNLIILRKGEPADPDDVKGLIKLRIAPGYQSDEDTAV